MPGLSKEMALFFKADKLVIIGI